MMETKYWASPCNLCDQGALFYEFCLEDHVPSDHLLRSIDRFVDLGEERAHLAPYYSTMGRPSVDPEPLIRMLIVGYCHGIRSERWRDYGFDGPSPVADMLDQLTER